MRTRFVAAAAAIMAAVLMLAGCNGASAGTGAGANAVVGKYEGYATTILDEHTAFDDTYSEGENYLELKSDGAAVLCLDGSSTDATYALDGDNITVTIGDVDSGETYDSVGTVKDGVLSIDFLGSGIEFVFLREGATAPFELDAKGVGQSSTSSDDVTADGVDASDTGDTGEAEVDVAEPGDDSASESGETGTVEQE